MTAPNPPGDEVLTARTAVHDRVAWLQAQPEMPWSKAVEAVEAEYGVSRSTAKRVVAAAGKAS